MTTSVSFDTATPYLASYVILRDGSKLAMVLRSNTNWMDNHWGLLAGKVEKNETFTAAALREAHEEGGVHISPNNLQLRLIAQRHTEDSDWVDALFEVSKWEGKAYNAEPHMHSSLEWFEIEAIPENTIPAVKAYLQAINEGKAFLEYGWPAK